MADDDSTVLATVEAGVADVVLNRPAAMNAINSRMAAELTHRLSEVSAQSDAHVVLLRGAGDRAFCVGADLKERSGFDSDGWRTQRKVFRSMFASLRTMPQPTVAVVGGYAMGGGMELALLADCVVASDDATFALPEAGLGIIPGGNGILTLTERVGAARAKEILWSGRRMSGQEAFASGIVTRLVEPASLTQQARDFARSLTVGSPAARREIKRLVHLAAVPSVSEWLEEEERSYQAMIDSPFRNEGLAAFHEHRAAGWRLDEPARSMTDRKR